MASIQTMLFPVALVLLLHAPGAQAQSQPSRFVSFGKVMHRFSDLIRAELKKTEKKEAEAAKVRKALATHRRQVKPFECFKGKGAKAGAKTTPDIPNTGYYDKSWGKDQRILINEKVFPDDIMKQLCEKKDSDGNPSLSKEEKECFIIDLLMIVLYHEYCHAQQKGGNSLAQHIKREKEAYKKSAAVMCLVLDEFPKRDGTGNQALRDCMLEKKKRELKKAVTGGV